MVVYVDNLYLYIEEGMMCGEFAAPSTYSYDEDANEMMASSSSIPVDKVALDSTLSVS